MASAVAPAVVRRLSGRAKFLTMVGLLLVAFYLLAVTPVRTYVQQRHDMQQAEQRYVVLKQTNEQLAVRSQQLQSDEEIKRLARERYELVEPGQQAFAVMPPSPQVTAPQGAPVTERKRGVLQTVWDTINPWN